MQQQTLDSHVKSCGIDASNVAQILTEVGCRLFLWDAPAADPEGVAAIRERALKVFEAAALLAQENPTPLRLQAQVHYRQGRHQEAARLCQQVERMRAVAPRELAAVLVLRAQINCSLPDAGRSSPLRVRQRLKDALELYRRSSRLDEELCNALEVPQMIDRLERCLGSD